MDDLGVPPDIQDFFNVEGPSFDYGGEVEQFSNDFHLVPVTTGLWRVGPGGFREVIITSSAMEAIAYLSLNAFRYQAPYALLFMAIGNLPHPSHFEAIRLAAQKRKITLVFPNDLTGRLADIVLAMGIRCKMVSVEWQNGKVLCCAGTRTFLTEPDQLSLHAFEKACAIRTQIRTRKPNQQNSFLEQLRNQPLQTNLKSLSVAG
ncbi:hypothetical protein [Mucilaginibacter agri]|uniref:Uncharacterized protein n=1 Tax=Mucilaginibacter agri TaxID=2695265 RepID=A0A966DT21_9SPHI|nr:hypothetical protein [Mucilaginibacter agri]NCD68304.1 hypothetical protein [Mucilaginibacter agri]